MSSFRKFYTECEMSVCAELNGLRGRPCIRITLPSGITLRPTLEDAESLGEAIIRVVRAAEEVEQ